MVFRRNPADLAATRVDAVSPGTIQVPRPTEEQRAPPFDLSLIDVDLMTASDIAWVNQYHASVRQKLAPSLAQPALDLPILALKVKVWI